MLSIDRVALPWFEGTGKSRAPFPRLFLTCVSQYIALPKVNSENCRVEGIFRNRHKGFEASCFGALSEHFP